MKNTLKQDRTSVICKECWERAFHSFGTAYIFEKRTKKLRKKLQFLTFLGIVVPVTVGSLIISFDVDFKYINFIIILAGIFGFVQLIITIWSVVVGWNDSLAFAKESISVNYELSNKYSSLGKDPPSKLSELNLKYEIFNTEYKYRNQQDNQQGITNKEKNMGMRSALRNFRRECYGCKKIPKSMKPSNCDICGNF